jgi:alcohol dehydrogenase class IV
MAAEHVVAPGGRPWLAAVEDRYVDGVELFRFRAPEVIYGRGSSARIAEHLPSPALAQPFVLTDQHLRDAGVGDAAITSLEEKGSPTVFVREPGEPTASEIDRLGDVARDADATAIVAIGGGATMDSAKCLRVILEFGGSVRDHAGEAPLQPGAGLPLAALPTTAGTGSESGIGALYIDDDTRAKVPVYAEGMLPSLAVSDPDLTRTVPPGPTAATGVDALAQAVGPFTGPLRHPITDAFSSKAIALILRHLPRAVADGDDMEARVAMAYGSLLSGMAMNNSEAMADQFFDEVIGPRYRVPHGTVAGVVLPYVVQYNRASAEDRTVLLAEAVLESSKSGEARADELVDALQILRHEIGLPDLEAVGVPEGDLPELADLAAHHYGVEMGINPRVLTPKGALAILEAAWHDRPPLELRA